MSGKNQPDDDDVLQAVILADSFNTKFEPLSLDTPRVSAFTNVGAPGTSHTF
jgi:hypothetical protein